MSDKLLDIVHSNVYSPMKITSMGGARYLVTFIDGKKDVVVWVESIWDCFEKFKEFKALVETQSKYKIKMFQLDIDGISFLQGIQPIFKESWYREANVYLI